MSAFGDGDPRTDIYNCLRQVQGDYDLKRDKLIAAALAALAFLAEQIKDSPQRK
jgi:hypothetical protein